MAKYESMMLQDPFELAGFLDLIQREGVRNYLEIGSKYGGSFWRVVNALPVGAKAVSVDLPHGDTSFKETQPHLEACCADLRRRGYDVALYLGDSTDPTVIEKVRRHAPFDLVFIDANHTEPYVRKDWANYGPMARIVAFHDIAWKPRPEPSKKMPIEVPAVWAELRQQYKFREIVAQGTRDNGIGILWRS